MSNVHGWTALAGAVVALAGGAATVQAAPKARQKPRPALAVGTSRDGSWRLEGRVLTVRLRDPLTRDSAVRKVPVLARCGDGVLEDGGSAVEAGALLGDLRSFARQGGRRARLDARARALRLTLSRDVAATATFCGLKAGAAAGSVPTAAAWMRRRRGSAPTCEHTSAEWTIFESRTVSVFERTTADEEIHESSLMRACTRPTGRSVGIAQQWSGGGGGGGTHEVAGFHSAGSWLAWRAASTASDPSGISGTAIVLRDLAADSAGTAPLTFRSADNEEIGGIEGLTPAGSVAWYATERSGTGPDGAPIPTYTLHVGTADGRAVEVARTGPGYFSSVFFDAAERTLHWTLDDETRGAARLP